MCDCRTVRMTVSNKLTIWQEAILQVLTVLPSIRLKGLRKAREFSIMVAIFRGRDSNPAYTANIETESIA